MVSILWPWVHACVLLYAAIYVAGTLFNFGGHFVHLTPLPIAVFGTLC